MDWSTGVLFLLAAVLGLNHVVIRTPWARNTPAVFWAINFVDLGLGSLVLVFGLPGFESMQIISWVVGLLLVAHVAQNLQLRSMWVEQERHAAQRERDEVRKQMRQAREAAEE